MNILREFDVFLTTVLVILSIFSFLLYYKYMYILIFLC